MTALVAGCAHVGELTVPSPDVEVLRVPDLCTHPGQLVTVAHGATALVVAVCHRGTGRREIQAAARRIGLDALAVQFVDVAAAAGDAARLSVLATAAARRAGHFGGSRAEHAKPTFPRSLDRRSFLRLPLPEYVAVPAVEQDLCAAAEGCTACMSTCPEDAYRWSGGRVEVDPARCEPCGRCLTACPTGAASNPAWTPAQLTAEVRALVADADEPRGVVLVCAASNVAETTPGWFPVAVPCTGMVTAGWALAPLLLGAHGVAVRGCSDTGCERGNDPLAAGAVELGRRLLQLFGLDADRLRSAPGALPDRALSRRDDLEMFTALGEHQVVGALAEAAAEDVEGRALSDPRARLGTVRLGAACTLCGACATGCPTDALTFVRDGSQVTLSFDAGRCTACEQCLDRCPERDAGAITVEHRVDPAALAAGAQSLLHDDVVTCADCGKPFGSQRLLDHVAGLLGEEHAAAQAAVGRRCLDCRSTVRAVW